MKGDNMEKIIDDYKKWKSEHDEGYCYDEIHECGSCTKGVRR